MQRWYYQDNYWGRLVKQILLPPMTAYSYDKTSGQSVRKAVYLPPRLSLRPLAGHKFLCYMMIGVALANMFGYNAVTFLFIVFLLWFLIICLKAIRQTNHVENSNVASERRGQLYNTNDSF